MDERKIIDFKSIHDRKHGPAPEFISLDELGRKWWSFMVDYTDGEYQFFFEIKAQSQEDAERRVGLIKSSARLSGQIFQQEPST